MIEPLKPVINVNGFINAPKPINKHKFIKIKHH